MSINARIIPQSRKHNLLQCRTIFGERWKERVYRKYVTKMLGKKYARQNPIRIHVLYRMLFSCAQSLIVDDFSPPSPLPLSLPQLPTYIFIYILLGINSICTKYKLSTIIYWCVCSIFELRLLLQCLRVLDNYSKQVPSGRVHCARTTR